MSIDKLQLIKRLINLGMSEREAKVYLCLLDKRIANAHELQKLSGIPQNKIYATIGSLTRQGYCVERKEGRKYIYEILDPSFTIDIPLKRLENRLKDSIDLKKELVEIYSKDIELTEPLEYFEVLHGNANIHRKYMSLLRSCAKEFLGFARGPYSSSTEEMVAEQIRENIAFLNRGGKIRTIYELNEKSPDWLQNHIEKVAEAGEDYRISEELPLKMIIFDRKTILLADKGDLVREGELTMSTIKQKVTVNGYVTLFEFFWNQSIELEEWKKTRR